MLNDKDVKFKMLKVVRSYNYQIDTPSDVYNFISSGFLQSTKISSENRKVIEES